MSERYPPDRRLEELERGICRLYAQVKELRAHINPEAPVPDSLPLSELVMSVRSYNCLHYEGYVTVRDVRAVPDHVLLRMPNFGKTSLKEVRDLTKVVV